MTPGTVGIISGELTRFADFSIAMMHLQKPEGTKMMWAKGLDVAGNCNRLVKALQGDWLWIMGDDHVFDPTLLMQLVAHELDVVVPLCLKRHAPYEVVVYRDEYLGEDGLIHYRFAELPEKGVHEIHAAGSAGMLIRRHVLEAIDGPVFETSKGMQNEDLLLCAKIRDAGFKIHCDVSARLGHIGTVGVWPMWQGDGWGTALDLGGGQITPLWRITEEGEEASTA